MRSARELQVNRWGGQNASRGLLTDRTADRSRYHLNHRGYRSAQPRQSADFCK